MTTNKTALFCELKKEGATGKTLVWRVTIEGNAYKASYGQEGGNFQTEKKEYKTGSNVGRSNEKTPEEQCLFEAEVKIRKKIEKGYQISNGYQFQTKNDAVIAQSTTAPKPMLAHEYHKHESKVADYDVLVQPKLDGNRCLFNVRTGEIVSRTGKPIFGMDHIVEELLDNAHRFHADIDWIDGELYAHGMEFQDLQSIVRRSKNKIKDKRIVEQVKFHIFDVVLKKTFRERHGLVEFVEELTHCVLVPFESRKKKNLDWVHDEWVKKGYEGIMLRKDSVVYESKRSYSLLKFKKFHQEEWEVVGMKPEKQADQLGAVILKMKNGQTRADGSDTFDARPAMTDKAKDEIWNNQSEYIGQIATVKFQEKSKDGTPRFPILLGFRHPNDM